MLGIIAANLRRRASRTLPTSMGIAVGVATIVALISVTAGLKRTAGDLVHLGQADVGVFQKGAADPTASVLPTSLAARLEKRPDVSAATPLLLLIESIKSQPQAVVFGADPQGFFTPRLGFDSGGPAGAGEVAVGDQLARSMHLHVGDPVTIKKRSLPV